MQGRAKKSITAINVATIAVAPLLWLLTVVLYERGVLSEVASLSFAGTAALTVMVPLSLILLPFELAVLLCFMMAAPQMVAILMFGAEAAVPTMLAVALGCLVFWLRIRIIVKLDNSVIRN